MVCWSVGHCVDCHPISCASRCDLGQGRLRQHVVAADIAATGSDERTAVVLQFCLCIVFDAWGFKGPCVGFHLWGARFSARAGACVSHGVLACVLYPSSFVSPFLPFYLSFLLSYLLSVSVWLDVSATTVVTTVDSMCDRAPCTTHQVHALHALAELPNVLVKLLRCCSKDCCENCKGS